MIYFVITLQTIRTLNTLSHRTLNTLQCESYLAIGFTIIFLLSKYKAVKRYNRFTTIGELSEQMQIVPYINFILRYGHMSTISTQFIFFQFLANEYFEY